MKTGRKNRRLDDHPLARDCRSAGPITTYIAVSADRGTCEHIHATIAEAVGCLRGDRHLEAVEGGERRPLTDVEFAAMVGQLERRGA